MCFPNVLALPEYIISHCGAASLPERIKGVDFRSTAGNCADRSFEPHRLFLWRCQRGVGGGGGANVAHAVPMWLASDILISSDVS